MLPCFHHYHHYLRFLTQSHRERETFTHTHKRAGDYTQWAKHKTRAHCLSLVSLLQPNSFTTTSLWPGFKACSSCPSLMHQSGLFLPLSLITYLPRKKKNYTPSCCFMFPANLALCLPSPPSGLFHFVSVSLTHSPPSSPPSLTLSPPSSPSLSSVPWHLALPSSTPFSTPSLSTLPPPVSFLLYVVV